MYKWKAGATEDTEILCLPFWSMIVCEVIVGRATNRTENLL
jgi:hypothetical protein